MNQKMGNVGYMKRIRMVLFLVSWFAMIDALAEPLLETLGLVNPPPPSLGELDAAKAKWESLRIEDYSFVISNQCACPSLAHTGPLQITVRNGKVKSAVYMGAPKDGYSPGQAVRRRTPLRVTIPGLFDLIEKRLLHLNPAHFKLKYDKTGSYPVQFEYNDPGAQNEEDLVVIKDLKLLK
jgi:hypothetical protein